MKLSRFATSISMLALLVGFVEAPHTHLHRSGREASRDAGHTHTVLHAHVTQHEPDHEHAPSDADPHDGDGLAVDAFVCQRVEKHVLADAALLRSNPLAPHALATVWTRVLPWPPPDYGSPPTLTAVSRAPPSLSSRSV